MAAAVEVVLTGYAKMTRTDELLDPRCYVATLTLRRLMSYIYIYIYGAPILDVSRSHTTTQHSR